MSDENANFAAGLAKMEELFGRPPEAAGSVLSAEFASHTIGHLFGKVWQGPELSIQERSLLTCAVLIALNRENEQRLHFSGARNIGIPRQKLEAVITHMAYYAGWPVSVSAYRVLNEVWPVE